MPDAGMGGWPDVAEHGISRLPQEHLVAGWYLLLAVVAVVVVIAARRALAALVLPHASLSADQIRAAVTEGVDAGIDGRFADLRGRVDDLRETVGGLEEALGELRQEAQRRHEQNIQRFAALEAGGRWSGDRPGPTKPRPRS